MNQERQIKIGEATRTTGKHSSDHRIKRFPKFLISGKYLQQAGFFIGDVVNVMVTENMIHIIKKGGNA